MIFRLTFAAVLIGALGADAQAPNVSEYDIKAAFLFNLAKFVEWPSQAFDRASDPFMICVAGDNPFGTSLEDVVRGKAVANRPILIRAVANPEQARTCEILFVSASEHKRERILLAALKGSSVLTVGDTDDFTANGGMVRFKVVAARVHIEIVAEAAQRTNLRFSSRLLSLADPGKH